MFVAWIKGHQIFPYRRCQVKRRKADGYVTDEPARTRLYSHTLSHHQLSGHVVKGEITQSPEKEESGPQGSDLKEASYKN